MAHKFTIEYDMHIGNFGDDGCDKCLGVYGTLDECQASFSTACERVHDHYMNLSYSKRKITSYLVAVYAWKVDEDGEITDEDAWNELTEEEKDIINSLSLIKESEI